MHSTLFAALALVSVASAFVDFRGLGGSHRRSIIDGLVHLNHEVDQRFEDSNTFFRAHYTAKHDSKWHFVELNEWTPTSRLHCSDDDSELAISHPSAALMSELMADGFANTVVTAHPKYNCGGRAIFRKLLGIVDQETRVVLKTAPMTYMDVFRDLDLVISTNHVHAVSAVKRAAASLQQRPQARGFHQQSIWGTITNDASSVVSDAANGVESAVSGAVSDVDQAASAVVSDAKEVGGIAAGDYSTTRAWNLPGCNYNNDVSSSFTDWDIVDSNAKVAVSFDFQPTINLVLSISDWSLQNVEVYFEGSVNAGVTGKFSSTISQTYSNKQQITVINLSPITFAIGPVPVVLTPSIPINAGYTASIDGELTLTAVVSASSTVSYGFGYSPSTGHRTISDHSWSYNYDFHPRTFSLTVGLKAYVQPVLNANIDYIGNVGLGAAIYGDVVVQSNGDCAFDLTINAQPVISVTASLGVTLMDHSIFSDSWGPYSLWSSKYPLYSYCLPMPAGVTDSSSGSAAHATSGSAGAAPVAPASGTDSAGAAPVAPASGTGSAGAAPVAPASGTGSAGAAPVAPASGTGSAGAAPVAPASGTGSAGAAPVAPASGTSSAGAAPVAPASGTGSRSAGAAPASGSGSAGGRRFDAQSSSSSNIATVRPANVTRPHVTRITHAALGAGNVGKVWSGRSVSCGAYDMSYSLQFDVDSQSRSVMHLVLTKSTVAPGQHGLISALAHVVYTAPTLPTLGAVMTFALNNTAAHYLATSNPTQLSISPPSTMTLTFSPSDTRFVSMNSALTCGAVPLTAPESNNDNRTFSILASGGARRTADVEAEVLRATSGNQQATAASPSSDSRGVNAAVAVYAVVASVCAVVALATAFVVYRRTQAAPTRQPRVAPEPGSETLHAMMLAENDVPLTEAQP